MSVNEFPFENYRMKLPRLRRVTAVKASNMAKKHFQDSFKNEGFMDSGIRKWKPSRRAVRTGGKTLTDTGALRRSIKPVSVTFRQSRISTVGIVYARRHNQGVRMPKRQFMGNSKKLEQKTADMIAKEFLKIFFS